MFQRAIKQNSLEIAVSRIRIYSLIDVVVQLNVEHVVDVLVAVDMLHVVDTLRLCVSREISCLTVLIALALLSCVGQLRAVNWFLNLVFIQVIISSLHLPSVIH